ncbi:uncharacterized protein FYW47_013004 [Aplochiton taeniatus]
MTNYKVFHTQLSSIMEALTKAAVAEICELVDYSYGVLQFEISKSHKENETLRRKLKLIETIIARGHKGNFATLENGEELDGLVTEITVERTFTPGVASKQRLNLRRSGTNLLGLDCSEQQGPNSESTTREPTEEGELEPDLVLIKEEKSEERPNSVTSDSLLLSKDGTEAPSVEADDCEEGPSRMITNSATFGLRHWDPSGEEAVKPHELHSLPGSCSPVGGPCDESEEPVYDLDSDSEPSPSTQKTILFGSGSSTNSSLGTFELKRGVSMINSLPYDVELEMCSSWSDQSISGAHQQYLKADHRAVQQDKLSDLSSASFPMNLGLGATKMDQLDLNRYCRDRRFICNYCGKSFTSPRSLETHVRVHTGERPYSCAQCGKRFTQSGHLKTHQSVHTGERPFACEHCGKRFAGKQNLRIHQQKHHLKV